MKRSELKNRRRRPGLLPAAALMLALGALVLTGCGGSSEASTSSGGSESSGSEAGGAEGNEGGPGTFAISAEQRSCLKEKGVELPEFKGGQGGPPQDGGPPEGFEPSEGGELPEGGPPAGGEGFGNSKAFEECGVELGEFKGGPGKGAPNVNSAVFKKQIKEYVACVRENGYELAEPNFSGEGPVFEKSESESSAFKKASAQCQELLGGPGREGSSGEPESG